jgi:hypothetical protein
MSEQLPSDQRYVLGYIMYYQMLEWSLKAAAKCAVLVFAYWVLK